MTTIPFIEHLSETWLLKRTYHAQLRNGRELSIPDFTQAMKQIMDSPMPLSTWQEISQAEAQSAYQQGKPILLYGEHAWEHPQGAPGTWRPNKNMRSIIYGNEPAQPEALCGTEYALCYLDPKRGRFSNAAWNAWFSPESATILEDLEDLAVLFLGPYVQFPYTTHYTVVEASGQVHEYADRAGAREGFQTFPLQEVGKQSDLHILSPQFCYYHEVTCPGGIYRLEFFGPRMDEQGYRVKETEERGKEVMFPERSQLRQ
jgi:hypothetical protein